ncbi:MAG TPA: hypothetical protein VG779_12510 [Actinomycetota bacterium]|nr:hypothetical protein [Actinomycetota bacterium]
MSTHRRGLARAVLGMVGAAAAMVVLSAAAAPAPAAALPAPAATVAPVCTVITQADSGTTFFMGLQSCDLLELTDTGGIQWGTPAVTGDSVHLEPLPVATPVAGQFWRIVADKLGTSTITALGRPVCTGPVCPQYVVLFQVEIVVLPAP